jgi:hypothetical protein
MIAQALGIGAKYQEDKNTPAMKRAKLAERGARRKDEIEQAVEEEDTEIIEKRLSE